MKKTKIKKKYVKKIKGIKKRRPETAQKIIFFHEMLQEIVQPIEVKNERKKKPSPKP